jgi:hypothetical protein
VHNEDKNQKLTDGPPLVALCVVVTVIGLIVALSVGAPVQVTGLLAGAAAALLAALAVYIRRTLS